MKKRRRAYFIYEDKHHQFLQTHYKGISTRELAKLFNKEFNTEIRYGQLRSYKDSRGMKSGYNAQFKKGNVPKTAYKKGSVPSTKLPVGTETLTTKGVYLKVAEPDHWIAKQYLVWQKEFGKIPAESVLFFLDGDKSNCTLENIECMKKAAFIGMARNKRFSDNPILTKTGVLLSEITLRESEIIRGE